MGKGKSLRVCIFASYSDALSQIIDRFATDGVHVVGVFFAPDTVRRLSWRTRLSNFLTQGKFNEPAALLNANGIPYTFVQSHNGKDTLEALQSADPDILLLYGTNIIREEALSIPKVGVLNAHSSLLPKYRGARAEFWILYNNEPQYAGVTIHWVTPGLDEGDIFLQEPIIVEAHDTPQSLRKKSIPIAAKLFVDAIKRIEHGDIIRTPQNPALATKYGRPTEADKAAFKKRRYFR